MVLQRAWTKEMPSLTVVVVGVLLAFSIPCTAETLVYPHRSCLLINFLIRMYVCALALLTRSCCIRRSIVSYTKVLILNFCQVLFGFYLHGQYGWWLNDHYVKFIGIVKTWRNDSILYFFSGFRAVTCYTYTRGKLILGSPKLSSKLYSRSSKNSVTTADTRASFFSRDSR